MMQATTKGRSGFVLTAIARILPVTLAVASSCGGLAQAPSHPVVFHVRVATPLPAPLSGRLLIFFKQGKGDKEVDAEEFHPEAVSVTAREVRDLAPGSTVDIDADELAFPGSFSKLPAGDYEVQAALDGEHTYNYSGRAPTDWISPVTEIAHWSPGAATPVLTLDRHALPDPAHAAALSKAHEAVAPGSVERVEMQSALLSRFWGHPVMVRAWVMLPPHYAASATERYPTAYWTHGFGGEMEYALLSGVRLRDRMVSGKLPPMIWVMLDESIAQGTHEFADSVNNGPWGAALTSEFIPYLEGKYRMDARPSGRLLTGHSSGGWASLQLEIHYPQIFGGTWSTSPDPSDFHDFTGSNLYAPRANVYHDASGKPTPIMRDKGKVQASFEQFAKLEEVLGPFGGQVASFEWVFSPKGASGAPEPMFDRTTGDVDPKVVAYWHDHYDLASQVEQHWTERAAVLKGRIHLYVGTADTFYLDGAAHLFEARLKAVGADAHFTYIPDRTHFDLYQVGEDRAGLSDEIGAQMYAVARPGKMWKRTPQAADPAH